jgi:hypothetical protein
MYRSANLSLYTDLSEPEAHAVLERLETTLHALNNYWRRPLRGTIQCYVVQHLEAWNDRELPHPMARILIGRIGGAAFRCAGDASEPGHNRIVVLASAAPGVVDHEVVHAYCGQTFGTTGPLWYREGMAQLMTSPLEMARGIDLPPETLECLTSGPKRTLADVVSGDKSLQKLCDSLEAKSAAHNGLIGLIPDNEWKDTDVQSLLDIKRTYAWSWLACYLLENNPNYRARFRAMGQDFLANEENTFGKRFDPLAKQLTFEYEFTVAHLAPGYRVDLCAWDWEKRFRPLVGARPVRARVEAARGYQASGLLLSAGQAYTFEASGSWTTGAHDRPITADGSVHGAGRLEAVVLRDYQLSEPFLLGERGSFSAPCDGQLYLRCRDNWSELGDNEGSVLVTLSRAH